MPEYLAPGVYVEETSFRAKSIEGVSTTTTAFVGPARFGPVDIEPDIVTSLVEFERVYGDRQQLDFGGSLLHNYLWHAARAFFEEGGKRLYVARVFKPLAGDYPPRDSATKEVSFGRAASAPKTGADYRDGHARRSIPTSGSSPLIEVRARFPGAAGNMLARFTVRLGQNILTAEEVRDGNGNVMTDSGGRLMQRAAVRGLAEHDVVWISDRSSPVGSPPGSGTLYVATSSYDAAKQERVWSFSGAGGATLSLSQLTAPEAGADPAATDQVRIATLAVTVATADGSTLVWEGIAPDPRHQRAGSRDSLDARFSATPASLGEARSLPIVVEIGSVAGSPARAATGLDVIDALVQETQGRSVLLGQAINDLRSSDRDRSVDIVLQGGNDGQRPGFAEYEGSAKDTEQTKTGLKALEDIEDISIVAAPGSTYGYENGYRDDATTITNLLISHASRMRYRIAVLDCGDGQSIADVRAMRARFDTTYAAFYYPWVRILDPVTREEVSMPPSGFVAGIYARNDINRAVYKAPANEVVNLAIGFEKMLNKAQQEVLNPEGINCFRFFEGRGYRLWGARTASSDPEWKYVNLRRYFAYMERSIDKGTQWAVFEPNGERLWDNVRQTIRDFLFNEWQNGALLGERAEQAFFVRCDRSTMTQNDLDNGRMVCLIGVAPLRPAEFVIFRIGQWTADRKS